MGVSTPGYGHGLQTAAMPWPPLDDMSRVELKMYWAVREEATLRELPLEEQLTVRGSIDVVDAEAPADCSRVLLAWCDQGLVTLMTAADEVELSPEDARPLLERPEAWTDDHVVVATEAGVAALLA